MSTRRLIAPLTEGWNRGEKDWSYVKDASGDIARWEPSRTEEAMSPTQYLNSLKDPARKAEMKALDALIRKALPREKRIVDRGMLGYGPFHYKYASGREGDTAKVGLSSRAQYISVYLLGIKDGKYIAESYRKALGKASVGKSCIRFRSLEDIDTRVLAKAIKESVANMDAWARGEH